MLYQYARPITKLNLTVLLLQILFNGHTGAHMGILSELEPKPDLAVLSVAGQPCYNGGGYTGTATEFILDALKRLGHPKQVRQSQSTRIPELIPVHGLFRQGNLGTPRQGTHSPLRDRSGTARGSRTQRYSVRNPYPPSCRATEGVRQVIVVCLWVQPEMYLSVA